MKRVINSKGNVVTRISRDISVSTIEETKKISKEIDEIVEKIQDIFFVKCESHAKVEVGKDGETILHCKLDIY